MSASLEQIDEDVFRDCPIEKLDFSSCTKLKGANYAFGSCRELKELILPPNLEGIDFSYLDNTQVTELVIPASTKNIKGVPKEGLVCEVEAGSPAQEYFDKNMISYRLAGTGEVVENKLPDWGAAYLDKVNTYISEGTHGDNIQYCLIDINRDHIPELAIHSEKDGTVQYYDPGSEEMTEDYTTYYDGGLYTFFEGKISELENFSGNDCQKELYCYHPVNNYYAVDVEKTYGDVYGYDKPIGDGIDPTNDAERQFLVYSIENGKPKLIHEFRTVTDLNYDDTFTIDGKAVDISEYHEKMAAYLFGDNMMEEESYVLPGEPGYEEFKAWYEDIGEKVPNAADFPPIDIRWSYETDTEKLMPMITKYMKMQKG